MSGDADTLPVPFPRPATPRPWPASGLERLEALMAAGYVVEDIVSDAWEIEVTLVRGPSTESVTLGPDEAAALLVPTLG